MTDHGFRQGNLAANLKHSDPLDELAQIVSGQFDRKPKSQDPANKAFDIEAELIRELDGPARMDETPQPAKPPVRSLATPHLQKPLLPAHSAPSLDTTLEDQLMGELHVSGGGSAAGGDNGQTARRNSWEVAWAEATLESLEPSGLVPQDWSPASSKAANPAPELRALNLGDLESEFEKSFAVPGKNGLPSDLTPAADDLDSLAQEFTIDGEAPSPNPGVGAVSAVGPAARVQVQPRAATPAQGQHVFSEIDLDFGTAFKTAFERIESARAAMPTQARAKADLWNGAREPAPEPAAQPAPVINERSLEEHFASAFAEELELSVAAIRGGQKAAASSAPAHGTASSRMPAEPIARAPKGAAPRPVRGPDPYAALLERELQASELNPGAGQAGQEEYYQEQPKRTGRGFKIAVYALAVGLVAGLGAVSYGYFRGGDNGSEPVLIKADTDPVKIKPNNRGGAEIANQDKAAYERLSGQFSNDAKQEKLVDSAEEPVNIAIADVEGQAAQQTLTQIGLQTGVQGEEKTGERLAPSEEEKSNAVVAIQPRRVKTLSVRPDGTIVAAEANPVVNEAANGAVPVLALKADETAQTDAAAKRLIEKAVAADPLKTETVRITSEKTGTAVKAALETVAKAGAKAQQAVEPVKDVQVKLASVETQTDGTAATARSEWAVQVSSQKSADDAEAAYRNLLRKFPQLLDGRQMAVQRAEVADKGTFYRVRIQADTKEDAGAFCEKLKAAGGSCFVTR